MEHATNDLHVLIVTGLSGAGKTTAANAIEDLGFFCVDNMPPALIPKFTELSNQSEGRIKRVAFVVDVRGGWFFNDLSRALDDLRALGIRYEIIFLEASEEALIRRFKESRRKHPLNPDGDVTEAIKQERKMLAELRGKANTIIDTTGINVHALKAELSRLYASGSDSELTVTLVSFGFKYGLPMDSDLVMDVRFLPNPKYIESMADHTGEDPDVIDFVLNSDVTTAFIERFMDLVIFLLPHYIKEGKTHLVAAIGCTGGQHRSVALTNHIGRQIGALGYRTIIKHRDIEKHR
ncbi:MAG: RNase adapter RapZ [Solirubrobacterales bacterium]